MIAQEFGANDVDGTIEKESIQSAAGAKSKHGVAQNEFVDLIKTLDLFQLKEIVFIMN